ncbi:unnamed protein product [Phyllotreta striolata]|uniref:Timeless-like protein n=1 Tax=Phyllotreta striolata TaxID=444603 RepID=A0A9N9XKW2_PHYSR|nr:unnamed protein product [Phyllotreta striolata]
MDISSVLSAEISATCNALGYFDEKSNKYFSDGNVLETVKDLVRYLRRDDENHSIRRQLGKSKVLQTDLLPLLKTYHEESDLFDVLLRLVMNLTTPPLLLFNFEIPTDLFQRNLYLEMDDHLQSYKESFADEGIWAVFSTHLSRILEIEHAERGEENSVKIERILVLIRNVLFVHSDSEERRPDNDASLHDQVLWALHHSGLLDIILYITTNPIEQTYYMYILEIMFFMLRNQRPQDLAQAALERSQTEKIRDEAELVNLKNVEQVRKQYKMKKYAGARHSRFGGTFVVQSMKSINDNELIYHKSLNKLESLDFDNGKTKRKTPKNRTPLQSNSIERRSAFMIRLFLKEFCIEFLNGAYNATLRYIKSVLVRSSDEAHDESYYFWAMSFFMAFNRSYKFEVKLVSETLSVESFYYIQQQSENYFDRIKTDKKRLKVWSRRLHMAILTYKELLLTLLAMDKSTDENVRESSKVIKNNLFYVPEYREFVLTLLISFDELKLTDAYLKDLLETQHHFLKMFEGYCNREGSLIVQKKSLHKRKKKAANRAASKEESTEKLNRLWESSSPQIVALLESGGSFLTREVPFDAASEVPVDDQKTDAIKKIQNKLRQSEFESAISIIRAAREVWPENNYFGSDNMTTEEEFLAMKEMFFADLGEEAPETNVQTESDGEEEEVRQEAREVNFNFTEFLGRLAHPKIVRTCGIALRTFETNPIGTNHSVVKLLHRIAFDCKMYVMLFQLSLFRTFQRIFELKDAPQYKELVKFSTYIVRQFINVSRTNDKVYIEALFWKTKKEAYEIEHGYGTSRTVATSGWSDEEKNELEVLFNEYHDTNVQEDIIDWILKNLINHTRTRRMVLRQLKVMDLIDTYKRNKQQTGIQRDWNPEEESQLGELFNRCKDSSDPVSSIIDQLSTKRTKKNVTDKLLELGLIRSKSEVRKKKEPNNERETTDVNRLYDSESDSSDEPTPKSPVAKKREFSVNTSKSEVVDLIRRILGADSDARVGVEWLKESIAEALEDAGDAAEDVPLVPLSEPAENCMENAGFQALLRALGITQPLDEQEAYWRIPKEIGKEVLENHLDLLECGLSGERDEEAQSPPHKRIRLSEERDF